MYSSEVSVFDFIYRSKADNSSYFISNSVVHENQLILVLILKLVIILVLQDCVDDAEKLLVFLLSIIPDLLDHSPGPNQYSDLNPVLGRDILVEEKGYQTCGIVLQFINKQLDVFVGGTQGNLNRIPDVLGLHFHFE